MVKKIILIAGGSGNLGSHLNFYLKDYCKVFSTYFNSVVGKLIMFFSLCGIWYHFFAGIRHLFWDMGYGFNLKWVELSSYSILALTFIFVLTSLLI